ncbi:hypothetical protein QEG73_02560 [Chitinophagaceae bacterium 26-R-25]|nr:hypothetical protein [Chitinophagaceae bacterium 26-R-25]
MATPKVFLSIGATANTQQEEFVSLIEQRLKTEELSPHTVGRTEFSSDSPLVAVKKLINECSGILVIALERTFFETGVEKRGGPHQANLANTKYATPWNQIESSMAYIKGLPILVIVEEGVRAEGLLEKGYDWYVMTVAPNAQSLTTQEFNGVLSDWKKKVVEFANTKTATLPPPKMSPGELTIGELVSNMRPAQLWAILAALAALMAGIFIIGQHFPAKP